jgi:hypothetical protein
LASNSYRQSFKNTTEKSTKADFEYYFQKKNNSQIIIDENYNNDGSLQIAHKYIKNVNKQNLRNRIQIPKMKANLEHVSKTRRDL